MNYTQSTKVIFTAILCAFPNLICSKVFAQSGPVPGVPRTGAAMLSPSAVQNGMTGALSVQPTPFGAYADQTAGNFNIGGFSGCVLGGAQNGQGHGGLGSSSSIDTVTMCESIHGAGPLFPAVSGTFDATHFYPATPLTAANLALLHPGTVGANAGTWIVVPSGANNYVSWVTNWSPDGTSVSVIGWWVLGVSGYQTPSGTLSAYFGVNTKIWARNTVVSLDGNSFAKAAIGDEIDLENSRTDNPSIVGIAIAAMGNPLYNGIGYQARGVLGTSYQAQTGKIAGFSYAPSGQPTPANVAGFASMATLGAAFASVPKGNSTSPAFRVDANTGGIISNGSTVSANGLSTYSFPSPVNSISILNAGFYDASDTATVTIDAAPPGGTNATATPVYNLAQWTLGSGGTGYTTGDVCTLVGGTSTAAASIRITATGGVVTATNGNASGSYTILPAAPVSLNCPNGGSGATLSAATFGIRSFTMTNAGAGYTAMPSISVTGGINGYNAQVEPVMNPGFVVGADGMAQVLKLTVSTLPTCNAASDGKIAEVTDQNGLPSYGGALTGNGSLHWPVFCNGTSWMAH